MFSKPVLSVQLSFHEIAIGHVKSGLNQQLLCKAKPSGSSALTPSRHGIHRVHLAVTTGSPKKEVS